MTDHQTFHEPADVAQAEIDLNNLDPGTRAYVTQVMAEYHQQRIQAVRNGAPPPPTPVMADLVAAYKAELATKTSTGNGHATSEPPQPSDFLSRVVAWPRIGWQRLHQHSLALA